MSGAQAAPDAIEVHPERLRLQWPDGVAELNAATLRAACRCGGCRAGRNTSADAPPRLVGAEPIGLYALQLRFSDGHERGIYPWSLLRELARDGVGAA
ncbi:DUF971 domain-containing protein [uncultured Azohydromonas sp.]|jgi:Uncharacterized protein conserved in bacteria|uniref:DUF971 domain-containing protein n=1 Tax=uncultured Azohydromonas sp. TaxID=487342 RepID=UPI002622354B|nr:DUF971 domain-containing protein [uncultured Azohydromonas sp.]